MQKAALTLIELLVVLSIVAVLSTVALRSVVGTLDQQNYDANVLQLEQVELAVLGSDDSAGFLGDIGRLPRAFGNASATNFEQLAELWDQDYVINIVGISLYAINTPGGDAEVRLGTGWRGPYLNLGISRDELLDGFANPFVLLQADGSDSNDGDTIAIVQSLGSDDSVNGTGFEEDFEVIFQTNAGVLPAPDDVAVNRWRTQTGEGINVSIVAYPGPLIERENSVIAESVVIRVYGADGSGNLVTLEQVEEPIPSTGIPQITNVILDGDDDSSVDTGPGLVLGPKVIRAYRVEDSDIPAKQADVLADDKSISPVTHIVLDRLSRRDVELTLYTSP